MFELTFQMITAREGQFLRIEAPDRQAALREAAAALANALGRPGAHVHLADDGRFIASQGFWSLSGTYSLTSAGRAWRG